MFEGSCSSVLHGGISISRGGIRYLSILAHTRYNSHIMSEQIYDISTVKQLEDFVRQFIHSLKTQSNSATLITLSGDLGSGKTTFTQVLGKHLGVVGEITSPTYVIEQRYALSQGTHTALVHIDAYRLEEEQDPCKIGLNVTLENPQNLVVIEWPEKIADFIKQYQQISLVFDISGKVRTITSLT